jgi:hypothetical protein
MPYYIAFNMNSLAGQILPAPSSTSSSSSSTTSFYPSTRAEITTSPSNCSSLLSCQKSMFDNTTNFLASLQSLSLSLSLHSFLTFYNFYYLTRENELPSLSGHSCILPVYLFRVFHVIKVVGLCNKSKRKITFIFRIITLRCCNFFGIIMFTLNLYCE